MSSMLQFAMCAKKYLMQENILYPLGKKPVALTARKVGEIMAKTKNPLKSARHLHLYPKKTQEQMMKGLLGYKGK